MHKVAGVMSGIACALWASVAVASPGKVVAPTTIAVHASPDLDSTPIAQLDTDMTVCVLDAPDATVEHRAGWSAVRMPDGFVGYVPANAIELGESLPNDPACSRPQPGGGVMPPEAPSRILAPPAAPPPGTAAWAPPPSEAPLRSRAAPPPPLQPDTPLPSGFLPLHPTRLMFGFGLGAAGVRDKDSTTQAIGGGGIDGELSASLQIFDVFAITGAFGFSSPGDNGTFSQMVMSENGGDAFDATSNVTILRYSLALTARTPFYGLGQTRKGWVGGALFAGFGWAGLSGRRSIENCSDCRVDDLVLNGGNFWRVGADLAIPAANPRFRWGFNVAYQSYLGDASLSQEFLVSLTGWYL